jgi:prepilin peptidase CpaA
MLLELAIMFVFPAVMVLAGAMDLFTMTIPNRITLILVAGFAVLAPLAGFGWETVALHVAAGAAMLVVGIALFAAASLWMGYGYVYQFAMVTALCGGALTLLMLGLRMFPLPAALNGQNWIARLHDAGRGVPYGVAVSAAGLIVYPHTSWIQAII